MRTIPALLLLPDSRLHQEGAARWAGPGPRGTGPRSRRASRERGQPRRRAAAQEAPLPTPRDRPDKERAATPPWLVLSQASGWGETESLSETGMNELTEGGATARPAAKAVVAFFFGTQSSNPCLKPGRRPSAAVREAGSLPSQLQAGSDPARSGGPREVSLDKPRLGHARRRGLFPAMPGISKNPQHSRGLLGQGEGSRKTATTLGKNCEGPKGVGRGSRGQPKTHIPPGIAPFGEV